MNWSLMPTGRTWKTGAPLVAACLLIRGGSSRDKPIGQWDSEDAKQVLTGSPWAKSVTPQWVRDLSPDQRRIWATWGPIKAKASDSMVGSASSIRPGLRK